MPRSILAAGLALALPGCRSGPEQPADRPDTPALVVRIVAADWVEHGGERITVDRLAYEFRVAVREAERSGEPPPWVDLRAPRVERPWAAAVMQRIQDDAYAAGIRHLELSLEDA